MFLLLVGTAAAAIEAPADVTINADYDKFNDEDKDTISVSGTVNVKNTGIVDEKVTFKWDSLPSNYEFTNFEETLKVGESKEVSFTVKVPHDNAPGTESIGKLQLVNSAETLLDEVNVKQKTAEMLELDEIEVSYTSEDDNSESDDFSSDDSSYTLNDKVKPGTDVEIKIVLENRFHSDYNRDGDMDNIILTIEVDEEDIFDDDRGDEEEIDLSDIEAGDDDSYTYKFTVSPDASEDEYSFDIRIEAEDGESITYEIEKEVIIELGREKDDVQITKMEVGPTKITTCDASFTFDFEMKNVGTRSQKDSGYSIYNQDLGINENVQNLRLDRFSDSDNDFAKKFTFDISKNEKAGLFPLDIRTYRNGNKVMDVENTNVVIEKCTIKKDETPKVENKSDDVKNTSSNTITATTQNDKAKPVVVTVEDSKTSTANKITSGAVIKTVEQPYTMDDAIIAVMIIALVLVVVLVLFFIVIILK